MDKADEESGQLFSMTHTEQARLVMALVPAAMVVIDDQGRIQAFGKFAEEMFGYAEADVIGRNVSMLMGSPHRARHDGYLRHYLETGEKRIMGAPRLENARHANGHTFPIELSVGETRFGDSRCFVGFIRELSKTEHNRREMRTMLAELSHASRISAMGALATAMAHELNQPLTSIANYAEGLRNLMEQRHDFDARDEWLRILDNCSRQAIRAGQLLHRLREFVKGSEPHRESMPTAQLINEALSLALINGFKRTMHVDTDIAEGLPPLHVDPLQGQQVLFNLIRNAFEAMETQPHDDHRMMIRAVPAEDGFVHIAVEDSGPGIDPEILDTVFDSFVTTKGTGMGVGLAICQKIVEAHGGRIWVESSAELGGAAFHFTLPSIGCDEADDD